ncbi:hypothetical protein M413DRAFT_28143 [Hebeloma cylindrosporum]|uniref:Uncharacterized protein n=1 Tax=Hebeloma cylindrosporum TaxID=76867 RepID=A0A0C2YJ33_HEBCY|nr:hypothetical protein M413DRAFT_28143 [Hebeloma cylindrosporum h7]
MSDFPSRIPVLRRDAFMTTTKITKLKRIPSSQSTAAQPLQTHEDKTAARPWRRSWIKTADDSPAKAGDCARRPDGKMAGKKPFAPCIGSESFYLDPHANRAQKGVRGAWDEQLYVFGTSTPYNGASHGPQQGLSHDASTTLLIDPDLTCLAEKKHDDDQGGPHPEPKSEIR